MNCAMCILCACFIKRKKKTNVFLSPVEFVTELSFIVVKFAIDEMFASSCASTMGITNDTRAPRAARVITDGWGNLTAVILDLFLPSYYCFVPQTILSDFTVKRPKPRLAWFPYEDIVDGASLAISLPEALIQAGANWALKTTQHYTVFFHMLMQLDREGHFTSPQYIRIEYSTLTSVWEWSLFFASFRYWVFSLQSMYRTQMSPSINNKAPGKAQSYKSVIKV